MNTKRDEMWLLLGVLVTGMALVPVGAGTLSNISWTSRSGSYINDTIVNHASPLAFTATNDLAQPFLNAADSTIMLGYGSYYVISFRGFGEHTGVGTMEFLLDGVTPYSQSVIFPDPATASGVFASFLLPGGDMVTVSGTGLAADRIRIVADGPGLTGDQTPDAFYRFDYIRAADIPVPQLTVISTTPGHVTISWTPANAGFVLQETLSLSAEAWTNSPSGATNNVVVPTSLQSQFFRLSKP